MVYDACCVQASAKAHSHTKRTEFGKTLKFCSLQASPRSTLPVETVRQYHLNTSGSRLKR